MITDIRVQNFRSYNDDSFELSPAVNIIVGSNASGKTNLLEAVLVAASGASYRAKDAELVQFDKPWARIKAHTKNDSRIVTIKIDETGIKKQFKINDQTYLRLSLQKSLPVVVFEPNNLRMLSGSPELRRQFLDDLLKQIRPGFGVTYRQYKRALAQRNALLKKGYRIAEAQLFAWDVRLSELGARLANARHQLVKQMNSVAEQTYNELAGAKLKVEFVYQAAIDIDNYATDLLGKLEDSARSDCERGFTSHGPHRDDLQIYLDGHLAQESASRGEMRTLLLVCKVIETNLLEQARDVKPILLLDDVFSELDGARRQALTKFLQSYQTFITTTDADVVIQHFTEQANIIPINK